VRSLRSGRSVGALVGLITITGAAVLTATPAAAQDVTVRAVTVTPSKVDVATGFGTVTLDLTLQSHEPIGDTFGPCGGRGFTANALPVAGSRPWLATDDEVTAMDWLQWGPATRVSGTPTDGVWRTTALVSPVWTGSWTVTYVVNPVQPCGTLAIDVKGFGAVVDVGSARRPPWRVTQAPRAPTRVVTGEETWTPRVRVTDRVTGAGVPAFLRPCAACGTGDWEPRLPTGAVLSRASSSGYWESGPRSVRSDPFSMFLEAYGKRGTRGYSLESLGCVSPWVKWQANERVATSGRTVTITGNVWPAPRIYGAANPFIRFQVLTNGRWTTVTSVFVRQTGRYTLTWTAPSAGTFKVRAYKPGGVAGCKTSAGTVLPAVEVVVG
jgi:hypothetical protein